MNHGTRGSDDSTQQKKTTSTRLMSTWLKSSSQTPPDKKLATRMKARSTSRKKITKMTDREKEDVRKTTFDIRKFFRCVSTSILHKFMDSLTD